MSGSPIWRAGRTVRIAIPRKSRGVHATQVVAIHGAERKHDSVFSRRGRKFDAARDIRVIRETLALPGVGVFSTHERPFPHFEPTERT